MIMIMFKVELMIMITILLIQWLKTIMIMIEADDDANDCNMAAFNEEDDNVNSKLMITLMRMIMLRIMMTMMRMTMINMTVLKMTVMKMSMKRMRMMRNIMMRM